MKHRLGPEIKTINKKTHQHNFAGTVPSFSRDFLGMLFMCFPFSSKKTQHINKFDPHPFPGQARMFMFIDFLPRTEAWSPWWLAATTLQPNLRRFARCAHTHTLI